MTRGVLMCVDIFLFRQRDQHLGRRPAQAYWPATLIESASLEFLAMTPSGLPGIPAMSALVPQPQNGTNTLSLSFVGSDPQQTAKRRGSDVRRLVLGT